MAVNNADKLAVRGYDVVSYFSGEAKIGDPAISSEHEGSVYYFSNEKNKDAFDATPDKYKPAYGGWCAFAMSEGKQIDIDPRSFKVINGKLHLFYNGVGGDTKSMWEENESERLKKAADVWQSN